jgi:hypothetical protein
MPSTWITERIDTSDHRPSCSFKGHGAVANAVTGIMDALMKCPFSIGAEYIRIFKCLQNSKTGNVRVTYHWDAFVQPMMQWKSYNITYSKSVIAGLCIQHATRMRHIVVCGLSDSTILFHILINGMILEKKSRWTQNVYCDILYTFCPRHLSCQEEMREMQSKMYIGFHVKCLLSCSILMRLEFSGQIFEK